MTERNREAAQPPSFEVDEDEAVSLEDVRWADAPAFLLFWVLVVVVFTQFFTRYVLNNSLGWTEEVARHLLIALCFVGAVTAARKGSHIFLEFFYRFLPDRIGRGLSFVVELINAAFYGYLVYVSMRLAEKTQQRMVTLDLPKSLIYWICAASLTLMALYSLVWAVKKLRGEHPPAPGAGAPTPPPSSTIAE